MNISLTKSDEELKRVIGTNIKKYRQLREMNQTDLAKKIRRYNPDDPQSSISNISRLEREGTTSIQTLNLVADALDIPIYALLVGKKNYTVRNMCDILAQLAFICKADITPLDNGDVNICIHHRKVRELFPSSGVLDDDIVTTFILRFLENLGPIVEAEKKDPDTLGIFPNVYTSSNETEKARRAHIQAIKEHVQALIDTAGVVDLGNYTVENHMESMNNIKLQNAILMTPSDTGPALMKKEYERIKEAINDMDSFEKK